MYKFQIKILYACLTHYLSYQLPWKIITLATLDEFPIKPSKKKYLIYGILSGFFTSIVGTFLFEMKKGIVFSEDEIKKIFNIQKVCTISEKKDFGDSENILIFIEGILKLSEKDKLSIIYVGKESKEFNEYIINSISPSYKKENILFTDNFRDGFKNKNKLLICFCGKNKIENLHEFKTKIKLSGEKPSGLLIVKDY